MFLGVQYYRPPFPQRHHWPDDLSAIRDAGLGGIQLWCIWGWIEHEPGRFDYDDYDELVRLAGRRGLKVLLSTLAEIQPFWIHRLVPRAHLVDHLDRPVVSTPRAEVNVGLTPGGCFDHPGIAARMRAFLTDIASRYGRESHLFGWDCWNETRWNVHADGLTCFCPHTLAAFRDWLRGRYGDLAGLSAAWKRRYASWDDVRPGKRVAGPFGDMMDFARFQSWRTTRHCRFRYEALRAGGAVQTITAHGPMPTIHTPPVLPECPLCRGNDWEMADVLDGVGSSTFPVSGAMDDAYVGTRFNEVASAAQGKTLWLSELQGSGSTVGYRSRGAARAAGPLAQRRWTLDLLARGYQAVVYWQWRDEKFCREAGGGGLAGRDGLAPQRIAALRRTAEWIAASRELLSGYRPDPPRVGVLFGPDNYYLNWAMTGEVWDVMHSVVGYAMALERLRIDYRFVESAHLDALDGLDVLLMPFCQVLPPATRAAVLAMLARGGRVLVEAETDAYGETGFYRDCDERDFLREVGIEDLGRRPLPAGETLTFALDGGDVVLPVQHFLTPLAEPPGGDVLARDGEGQPLLLRRPVARGALFYLGGFAGKAYYDQRNVGLGAVADRPAAGPAARGLETLLEHVCRDAGLRQPVALRTDQPGESKLTWRVGSAGGRRILFLLNGDDERPVRVELERWDRWTPDAQPPGLSLAGGQALRDGAVDIPAGDVAVVCLDGPAPAPAPG